MSVLAIAPFLAYLLVIAAMPLFLARFLQRFDYRPVAAGLPRPQALFTLRPRGGVRLRLSPRSRRATAHPAAASQLAEAR